MADSRKGGIRLNPSFLLALQPGHDSVDKLLQFRQFGAICLQLHTATMSDSLWFENQRAAFAAFYIIG